MKIHESKSVFLKYEFLIPTIFVGIVNRRIDSVYVSKERINLPIEYVGRYIRRPPFQKSG